MKIRSAFLTVLFLLIVSPLMAAVAVSYTPGTNIMDVTGGTEGTSALMIDLLQFDFDTPYTLLDAAVIDNDPDEMSLDNPVRAKDSRGLKLLISADVDRAGATVDIVGRDADGDSVTESGIDIATALTTAVETESKYSQIFTVTFNGMTNGDEVTITQPRLGVIAAGLEPDIIVNGGFDADTDWIKSIEWSIAGGVLSCDGTQSSVVNTSQHHILNDELYKATFKIKNYSAGNFRIFIGGLAGSVEYSANGKYEWFTRSDTDTVYLHAKVGFIGSIDNVSVQKLTGQYNIGCNILFGDGSTPSYFKSLNEMIYFEDGFVFERKANATLQVGNLVDGRGANGGRWSINPTGNPILANAGNTYFYGNTFENRSSSAAFPQFRTGNVVFKDGSIVNIGNGGLWFISGNWTFDRMNVVNSKTLITISPLLMNDVLSIDSGIEVTFSGTETVFSGLKLSSSSNILVAGPSTSAVSVGMTGATPTIEIISDESNFFARYEEINIHLNDKTGASLQGAIVTATSFGNIVSNDGGSTFYRCIVDHTAGTFATDVSAGKWELTTAANAALAGVTGAAQEGEWITGIDYTAAAEEFSELTDANGDIAEQTLTYKKWIGTSEAMLSYSPHTFTATKAREGTVEILNVTVDSPIDWTITLTIGDKWPYRGKKVGY